MSDPEYDALMIAGLVHHGISQDEAENFVKSEGAGRAWVWLRTCKDCRAERPLSCGKESK
jgi:hypothetical protein